MAGASVPEGTPVPGAPKAPRLVPILLLGSGGRVMVPAEEGPEEARGPDGRAIDLFDFTDYLAEKFRRLYVVDLDGLRRDRPQLDYLQEITRDTNVWVDAGLRGPDAVIDILVAGARRAVVTTGRFGGPEDLERAWRLSPEIVLEIETGPGNRVVGESDWGGDPAKVPALARAIGLKDVVLSPRGAPVDWSLVTRIAVEGPTWIDGTFDRAEESRLVPAGVAGAFFHVREEIETFGAMEPKG